MLVWFDLWTLQVTTVCACPSQHCCHSGKTTSLEVRRLPTWQKQLLCDGIAALWSVLHHHHHHHSLLVVHFSTPVRLSVCPAAGTISGEEMPIIARTNIKEHRDSFSCEKFNFRVHQNITFYVYVSNFSWPIKIQVRLRFCSGGFWSMCVCREGSTGGVGRQQRWRLELRKLTIMWPQQTGSDTLLLTCLLIIHILFNVDSIRRHNQLVN